MCYRKCNEAFKTDKYLDIKSFSCKKCLFGKLVLACEDEIFNTTETSVDNKKSTYERGNCLIHTISLIIICLLSLFLACLLVVITSCYSCYYF